VTAVVAVRRASLRQVAWQHPEAGAAAVAGLAWAGLLLAVAGPAPIRQLHADAHRDHPLLAGAFGWMAMSVAMMVPAALPVARGHARAALWARRRRTVGLFFGGYLGVWAAFGAVAAVAVAFAADVLGAEHRVLLFAALVGAAAWQGADVKWRAVRACHQSAPLPARGARADAACVRAGLAYGGRCAVSCWAPMAAMAVAGHAAIGLMLVLTVIVVAEKRLARPARLALPIAAVLAGDAFLALAT
jgi:predicted metal-binding membrane protein